MTSDGEPPAFPAPSYPDPPQPGQPPAPRGQFPGQQYTGQPVNQQWAPVAGYQPPPIRELGGYDRPPKSSASRVILGAVGVVVVALVVAAVIGFATRSKSDNTAISVPSINITFPSLDLTSPANPGSAQNTIQASGQLGSTITLNGQSTGEKLDVALLKIAPTTTATDGFSTPPAGDRLFAAQFRLTNTGTIAYTDAPDNDAVALDVAGHQYQTDIVASVSAGPLFSDQLNIAPGSAASGWIVFDVPSATTITTVQFTTDSGFGNTGKWTVT
jgi:hypothetical protein